MLSSLNRVTAIILGVLYFAFGIFGFFVTSTIPFNGTQGPLFIGIFTVNPLQNLIHLFTGVVLLICGLASLASARAANTLFGIVYGLAGLLGLFVSWGYHPANVFALNGSDDLAHILTAAVLLVIAFGTDKVARAPKIA